MSLLGLTMKVMALSAKEKAGTLTDDEARQLADVRHQLLNGISFAVPDNRVFDPCNLMKDA